MATLVLTAAGSVIGGPIGGAIGAALGRAIDRDVLFAPKRREGPRLTELAVQTSSYGAPIPKLFGTMRVAGTVIWSTDLIEARSTESGGKGQPETTRYSYSASFAVLLSARAILNVKRIWADGKLLRGAGGDFKSRVGAFRLHGGGEDQPVDPLIASLEGAAVTPAHRGAAYAVFEDLQLADFGNRIPSLTFEVEADGGDVDIGAIAGSLTGGEVVGNGGLRLSGFSAYGSDDRTVIEMLAEAGGCWFAGGANGLTMSSGRGAAVTLSDDGARPPGAEAATRERKIAAADTVPDIVSVRHYDPARDYQAGIQRAVRPGGGRAIAALDLPAALNAASAKAVAEAALGRADAERLHRRVAVPWDSIGIGPGARVRIAGEAALWRVVDWSLEAMLLVLDLAPIGYPPPVAIASPGRVLGAPDALIGRTVLAAFELPLLDDSLHSAPVLAVAAAGEGAGWRRSALLISEDGGASWRPAGGTALPAVIGTIVTPPGTAVAAIEDRTNSVEVELAHDSMVLGQADMAELDGGANLAMLGDELIQFGRAEQIGARRWRLTALWRGRRGTEGAIGAQQVGDAFVLLAKDSVITMSLASGTTGNVVEVEASGVGDVPDPAHVDVAITGRSIVPPSPVHLNAMNGADGLVVVRWVRRSRIGWRWIDGVDAALGEEAERYAVTVERADDDSIVIETGQPELTLSAAERGSGPARVTVRQIGSNGQSQPASIILD
ncbi:phage tail protein [Stakelama marina]|uniref:Phage tail protein n=1 Tax=Stakelama marina TaxID=2826939 RepID=A0A8T4IH63_9SPHN|nr:phage tail protein [Stakelama marina]MBR0553900.1 phage tail protein [Stakelama marina]